jgi:hypothetical protein
MEWSEYNGWENKFTWLVHLHLSSEQGMMQDMVDLVARTVDDRTAGLHVKWWVEDMVNGWVTGFPHRDTSSDAYIRLLAWDVVGTALAYADWDRLVKLFIGQETTSENPFTWTLYRRLVTVATFQQLVSALLQTASSLYAGADTLHEWFRESVDEWFNAALPQRQQSPAVLMLVHNLFQDVDGVVAWEHVARAFRAGY